MEYEEQTLSDSNTDENPNNLHFPMEAIRARLKDKNISHDVGPTAAVYCSAILQYLTSKVITEAVKSIGIINEKSQSPTKRATLTGKRQRSDDEQEQSENNQYSQDETVSIPPAKKRRICPKDITRALQTDASLKEFAHLIQVTNANTTDSSHATHSRRYMHGDIDQKHKHKNKNNSNNNNNKHVHALDGVIIAFEANFEVSRTPYAEQLKHSLQTLYAQQMDKENICRQVIYQKPKRKIRYADADEDEEDDDDDNESESDNEHEADIDVLASSSATKKITGCVLRENMCQALNAEFMTNPKTYCLTWLYHLSTIVSQQLHFAVTHCQHGTGSDKFIVMNRSPIGLLSMAMLFMNKKWLNTAQFRLYLNSHSTHLFPACYRPDITVFVVQQQQSADDVDRNRNMNMNRSMNVDLVFNAQDRLLRDDFLFELLIQKIASRKYGKYVFFRHLHGTLNMEKVSKVILDVLQNKQAVCKIYWEADLKAFNNTQNPNIVNPNRRIIYNEERQIAEGLKMIARGQLAKCDVVYIHISLWMKPKQEFKQLILAHLTRFESICFYALRHHDLDDRAKQIVHWIFTQRH